MPAMHCPRCGPSRLAPRGLREMRRGRHANVVGRDLRLIRDPYWDRAGRGDGAPTLEQIDVDPATELPSDFARVPSEAKPGDRCSRRLAGLPSDTRAGRV